MEIIAPQRATQTDTPSRRNIITGFLLDISGSMEGPKLRNALNTIKQLAKVILSEESIRSWIYVITFHSTAELVIPFQEITESTLTSINAKLDHIYTKGSTNYECAFKKQTEVLHEIITQKLDPTEKYHIIRFFETDGEITEGTSNIHKLYEMMRTTRIGKIEDKEEHPRSCDALLTSFGESRTESTVGGQYPAVEDYILGYGTEIDLNCLKKLASPHPPSSSSSSSIPNGTGSEYNCSSLITIIKPEDIGWQVGELLFKVIMRFGTKVTVTVESTARVELFEYQTHQWSTSTRFQSVIYGETKTLYIQYTPRDDNKLHVRIQYENQYTGSTHDVVFEHEIHHTDSPDDDESTSVPDLPTIITSPSVAPIIFGMIQIEIFKQFREIENPKSMYNKDRIVSEAYKTIRILKDFHAMMIETADANTGASESQFQNLLTDAKLIIGLTTINNMREQECIIYARRIASAEQDIFNTGVSVSRKYIENEEDYEDIARELIKKYEPRQEVHNAAHHQPPASISDTQRDDDDEADEADDDEADDDTFISRISTVPVPSMNRNGRQIGGKPSIIRSLCAHIAQSKQKNDDKTPERIYEEMRLQRTHYGRRCEYEDPINDWDEQQTQNNDTFSSTPSQDDEYTQRRMGMMRQMSSPSQP